jgi:hypothetical protein
MSIQISMFLEAIALEIQNLLLLQEVLIAQEM